MSLNKYITALSDADVMALFPSVIVQALVFGSRDGFMNGNQTHRLLCLKQSKQVMNVQRELFKIFT